ncbi:hypothetical protein [Nocardioides pakistanensis]
MKHTPQTALRMVAVGAVAALSIGLTAPAHAAPRHTALVDPTNDVVSYMTGETFDGNGADIEKVTARYQAKAKRVAVRVDYTNLTPANISPAAGYTHAIEVRVGKRLAYTITRAPGRRAAVENPRGRTVDRFVINRTNVRHDFVVFLVPKKILGKRAATVTVRALAGQSDRSMGYALTSDETAFTAPVRLR